MSEISDGITIARIFDAPPERVFAAWVEPEKFGRWFGGAASDVPVETISMDARAGGLWSALMLAGPERIEIPWSGEFVVVDPPSRLVLTLTDTAVDVDEPSRESVTVTFAPLGDKVTDEGNDRTEMTFRQSGGTLAPDEYEQARLGWQGFFDELELLLGE